MFAFNNIKQGLVNALEDLMLGAEHRYCVKHLYANLKRKGFKGKEFKDALWGVARAPNANTIQVLPRGD
jgi:predicted SprT family Zn-dependent metalloprotease